MLVKDYPDNSPDAMKKLLITLAAGAIAAAAVSYVRMRPEKTPPVDPATLHEGTLAMQTEAAEVFKRALWRRPAPGDKILHAERREWIKDSAQGAAHWQWFLAVEPGSALKTWLREKNPFAVHPDKSGAASGIKGAPAWFPYDFSGYEVHSGGTTGSLVFLFSRDGDTLYATGSGTGFTPGAPEGPKPSPSATAATGRLPLTLPPTSPAP